MKPIKEKMSVVVEVSNTSATFSVSLSNLLNEHICVGHLTSRSILDQGTLKGLGAKRNKVM